LGRWGGSQRSDLRFEKSEAGVGRGAELEVGRGEDKKIGNGLDLRDNSLDGGVWGLVL